MQPQPLSLYIHIPWCLQKCFYCDFNSTAITESTELDKYIAALGKDLRQELSACTQQNIKTIFIGGGTPTILPTKKLTNLLNTVYANINIDSSTEISIEINPETIDREKLLTLNQSGINRISFGVQTFDNQQLQYLNRAHTSTKAIEVLKTAQNIGLSNINIDIMFGLPDQSIDQVLADINKAADLNPTHISHYQLTLEPETKLATTNPQMPDEELLAEMYGQSRSLLAKLGYHNYETSAFAKPGFECKHNLNYWQFGDFIGIGAGAHGKQTFEDKIIRYHKPDNYREYINAVEQESARKSELLLESEIVIEFMINAMRLTDGWNRQLFADRTGIDFSAIEEKVWRLVKLGLIECDATIVRPTVKGKMLLDEVLREFV
ncbi:MAG: radical SAM family heme chaperone HemW [Gammaproteobacteria bacterium]|nr:MAG: radical SAM family heme chaperone HemW [Gammaproteobacteria bacterium]